MFEIKTVAAVAISNTTYGYDKRYQYVIPTYLEGKVFVGARVLVPFGKGNRKRVALVIRFDSANGMDLSKFKPIHSVIDKEPLINNEMLELMMWIRENTLCTYFDAFKTLIPVGLSVSYTQKYSLSSEDIDTSILSVNAFELLKDLQDDFSVIDGAEKSTLSELVSGGFVIETDSVKRKKNDDTVKMIKLTEKYVLGEDTFNLTPKQKSIADFLLECSTASVKEITYICGVTTAVIKNMIKSGAVESYEYEIISIPDVNSDVSIDSIVLSRQQADVFDGTSKLVLDEKPSCALLHGVTGSGKTSVFAKLIEFTLNINKTVIMLIPEISLTPQAVGRFQSLFGNTVAIMHSSLSLTQRLNEYKRVKSGQAKIVIGTRSAIFAPLENIGLIIIDEEGERTYKSESSPRYDAREIAKKRCVTHNALLLMASATPSIESYYYAETNRYQLFEMPDRYSQNVLPYVEIIDLAYEGFYGSSNVFSERLVDEININLERNEQTILLLNRRGFHTFISCADCKEPVTCPNCSIPLTYHKINNKLICHYCSHTIDMVSKCPKCNKEHLKNMGIGTQKVEDEISSLFPNARILRMDADTTYSRYSYEKSFKAFENHEYDIMLGTQMIAKGLDFPDVTLVGVLSIDKALFTGDFRSYERTFSLVTQVVGRCGRGEKQGRAFIQTYVPEHYVINLAAEQNYKGFYEQEIAMRKTLTFPPFCDTCVLEFASVNDRAANLASNEFLRMLRDKIERENVTLPLRVIGPAKCIYEKINNKYRYRIIIKCKNNKAFRDFISQLYKLTFTKREFATVTTYLDINGDIGL